MVPFIRRQTPFFGWKDVSLIMPSIPGKHQWDVSTSEAIAIQRQLRSQVLTTSGISLTTLKTIAGVDAAYQDKTGQAKADTKLPASMSKNSGMSMSHSPSRVMGQLIGQARRLRQAIAPCTGQHHCYGSR